MNFNNSDDLESQKKRLKVLMENALSMYERRTRQAKEYIDLIDSWGRHPESPMQLKQMDILSIYNERANCAFEEYEAAYRKYHEFIEENYEE